MARASAIQIGRAWRVGSIYIQLSKNSWGWAKIRREPGHRISFSGRGRARPGVACGPGGPPYFAGLAAAESNVRLADARGSVRFFMRLPAFGSQILGLRGFSRSRGLG